MHLKKLELLGFKSFMEKTVLNFEPGITAVVGPNGAGKSNIFDAMRWVLGEQSVKALRGSQMEDVIFNGTDKREPLGMAEVTLTFDNLQKFFPVEHEEVAITRRIFRSGESEYLLNKAQVRLKDILDLLMGTGIGAESYSLIQQGKIDLILSSRPEDRRLVFDEASGITKYKSQKKDALRKLEETEQNLLRANDIITEVKRQIASLERQANKARKYKEVFEELKTKEIKTAGLEKNILQQEKDRIINKLSALEKDETALVEKVTGFEAKISESQAQTRALENAIMSAKDEIMNLENSLLRNNERVDFNKEKIKELEEDKLRLNTQIGESSERLKVDEQKIKELKSAYTNIHQLIEEKTSCLEKTKAQLESLELEIKLSLEDIQNAKTKIMEFAAKIADSRNQINDLNAKAQIHHARKKRLELEKAKITEEKTCADDNLAVLTAELKAMEDDFSRLALDIGAMQMELSRHQEELTQANSQIETLEKQCLTLESNREFLEKLKTKYDDIGESMNAILYLDKPPAEKVTGLVIKIKEAVTQVQLSGEAKPIDLDTSRITQEIGKVQEKIRALREFKSSLQAKMEGLNENISGCEKNLRAQEIALANKKISCQNASDAAAKITEERDIIISELSDISRAIADIEAETGALNSILATLIAEQAQSEGMITSRQENITRDAGTKEKLLVIIAQSKTELEALNKRIDSDRSTIETLESAYQRASENLKRLQTEEAQAREKQKALEAEICDLNKMTEEIKLNLRAKKDGLTESEEKYKAISEAALAVIKTIEFSRKELDTLKNELHKLQLEDKDIEFRYAALRERMMNTYKIDLDALAQESSDISPDTLNSEIESLKARLDSYGTVNLVAIEEYDELKKRYDFLTQQQNDLFAAKESLLEAIAKINRTTKKMFMETFEKICEEFRNYFRMLFNGGDARIFLIDEQDPLESGIEIICRPPGKKLQNVLLLSGGEKSMSAIALLFAIFKVKPSPFCVLDEIDAALDEANVDRFGSVVQDFAKQSQFIFITHNKKTISNADIMYGITMEESGVSKIISVKFTEKNKTQEPVPAA